MRELRILLIIIFFRLKNRCFIFASQRPEVFFGFVLVAISTVVIVFFLPALFNYDFAATVALFPDLSYPLIVTAFSPFLIWILKRNDSTSASFSLLDYIFKDYLKYLKALGLYFPAGILSIVMVYLVVSIFSNLSPVYSTLFWHCVGLLLFLIGYCIALTTNNILARFKIVHQTTAFFKYMIVISIMVMMALPIHRPLGVLWLAESLSTAGLIVVLFLQLVVYTLLLSRNISVGDKQIERKRGVLRFRQNINIYAALVLTDIHMSFWFLFFASIFIMLLSLVARQYFILLELFMTLLVIGNVGLIFDKLDKVTKPLHVMRASNFKFSLWILYITFGVSLLFAIFFHILMAQIHSVPILFLLQNSELFVKSFVLYFSIYLAILIYYLFGDYFGLIARTITSGLILVISARVVPSFVERILSFGNYYLGIGIILLVFFFLLLIQWVTVHEYKNSEFI